MTDMMTQDQMWATFAALDAVRSVHHEADLTLGRVRVSVPCRGGYVVRTLTQMPTPQGAAVLIADMDREARERDRRTSERLRVERDQDRS